MGFRKSNENHWCGGGLDEKKIIGGGGLDEKKISAGAGGSEIVSVPPPHVFLNGIALNHISTFLLNCTVYGHS